VTELATVDLWPGAQYQLVVRREIVAKQTRFQSLAIYDTETFGRALFLDRKIQSAETDEHIYHEALVQPALIAHGDPRNVFIAGGGEGATLREVLRFSSVRRAVMVDIDEEAVAFAREHMAAWHQGAFDDPRTELRFDDARAALERSAERFDAIVVDVTDPVSGGPSYRLFTEEFYRLAVDRLNPGGVLALQAESTALPIIEGHAAVARTVRAVFPIARSYAAFVPSFGEPWGFVVASRDVDPVALSDDEVDRRLRERGLANRHYDGESHRHMFALTRGVREAIAAAPRTITDDRPLIVA
jgi:spermidine synthase